MALVADQPGTVSVEASADEVQAGAVLPSVDEQGKVEGGDQKQPSDVSMALVADQPGTVSVEASADEVQAGAVLPSVDEQGKVEGGEQKQPSDVSMALVADQPVSSLGDAGLDLYCSVSNDFLSTSCSEEG
ncbi:hypothetical protein GUITHDRAFT_117867 [Guillardia theta CCMP2712]|uniref:Uncharacterized protein n=1 Tax=Guillardia theta (strain CCMP2712) TaxID=905079 RepID=L1IIM9_GUITC|nr:hypothetical protein GUITHDRAFT_117867 [Guillardia theta CCMP2712]EKX35952.1 hypothetical protein GUITHDRAFT_117867 [Guillardia theta CCMP2712]|eukprot:XP_005822932.1 hypothetical protein GUITHDRAFT_117867 [Guillardia theta CCMP2712]